MLSTGDFERVSVFNARRLSCDLSAMPVIARIAAQCEAVGAFQRAMPEVQGDAE